MGFYFATQREPWGLAGLSSISRALQRHLQLWERRCCVSLSTNRRRHWNLKRWSEVPEKQGMDWLSVSCSNLAPLFYLIHSHRELHLQANTANRDPQCTKHLCENGMFAILGTEHRGLNRNGGEGMIETVEGRKWHQWQVSRWLPETGSHEWKIHYHRPIQVKIIET